MSGRAGRRLASQAVALTGWTALGVGAVLAILHDGAGVRRRPSTRRPVAGGGRSRTSPPAVPRLHKPSRPRPALRRPAPPPPLPTIRLRVPAVAPAPVAAPAAVVEPAPPRARPRLLVLSRIGSVVRCTVLGASVVLTAVLFLPYLVGGRAFTVMSGSMTPAIRAGDVVVNERISPESARVGDVITFVSPGSHKLITHRVRRIRVSGRGVVSFVTKGDAANGVQRWNIPASGSIGLVRLKIPKLGYAMWWARTPAGRLLCLVVPAVLLGLGQLRRIWRPRESPDPVADSGSAV